VNKISLTEPEKAVLRELHKGGDVRKMETLTANVLGQAAESLKGKGFVRAIVNYGKLVDIAIKPQGIAYMEMYPDLDDPISVENEKLQVENLRLQNDDLRYKKKIRTWQIVATILGLGDVIWLVFSLLKR
jgi:hypothetical protein